MGQREVLKYLENQRALGNNLYLTVKQVQKGLIEMGLGNGSVKGASNDLFKLACYGHIEWKGRGIWSHQKLFRAFVKKN